MQTQYDLVVIGSGPGGYVAAIRSAQSGLKTAIVEARTVGGMCLNRGCIPTKTLLHISSLYREMSAGAEELGIIAKEVSFDAAKVSERKESTVARLREGVEQLLKANKVDIYQGRGKVLAAGKVLVTGTDPAESNIELQTRTIILAVGAEPAIPPIPGADLPGVVTSDKLLDDPFARESSAAVDSEVQDLVIIGGGVIGVEMASVYSDFGKRVTVIESLDRILNLLDMEIGQSVSLALGKKGVAIHAGATVSKIVTNGSAGAKALEVFFQKKTGEESVKAARVLISVGRRSQVKDLFAEGLNIKMNRGIVVDEHFQTSIPDIYAVGDCVDGTVQLAHFASAQATNAVRHIAGKSAEIDLSLVPMCIYGNPEIASVGITERVAKDRGIPVKSSKYLMTGNAKSIVEGQGRGFIKLIFNSETETLLGAHLMCARATDIIGELALAIENKTTAEKLASFMHPHPTFSEGIGEAVENLFGKAIHVAPKGR